MRHLVSTTAMNPIWARTASGSATSDADEYCATSTPARLTATNVPKLEATETAMLASA